MNNPVYPPPTHSLMPEQILAFQEKEFLLKTEELELRKRSDVT
ncbi:hypothetical protein BH10PSE19_BH10PSE19_02160 [soil metagenome]